MLHCSLVYVLQGCSLFLWVRSNSKVRASQGVKVLKYYETIKDLTHARAESDVALRVDVVPRRGRQTVRRQHDDRRRGNALRHLADSSPSTPSCAMRRGVAASLDY